MAAEGLVAAGIAAAFLCAVVTRSVRAGVPILLDFLLAAGLLRLVADVDWNAIAGAAAIILVRKLVSSALSVAGSTRS